MKKTLLLLLGLTVIAQLIIPASMIMKHERILRDGTLYRFKTRPIDPSDPFRGRYIWLGFENDYVATTTGTNSVTPKLNERVYVSLESNSNGFCKLTGWSRTKPESKDYLKLAYGGHRTQWDQETKKHTTVGLRFNLPFNRFYMEESKAPRAEKMVQSINLSPFEDNSNASTNCWAEVYVLNGRGIIDDVLIDGTSVHELTEKTGQ
jgi:uncharacterized membrane-anchored protein